MAKNTKQGKTKDRGPRTPQEILKKPSQGNHRAGLAALDRDSRELIDHLKTHLAEGLSEDEIVRVMGFPTVLRLRNLVERMYVAEEETLRNKTTARIYVDYCIRQVACAQRLDGVAAQCLEGNQAAGAVGAIKAKADLFDRMLTRGQELGVLARKPKEVHLIGRIDVMHMSTEDLKRQVAEENRALVKLAASLDAPAADRALLAEAVNGNGHDLENTDAPSGAPGGR